MAGTVAPSTAAAAPQACVWTPATLPLPAGALTGEVIAADGSGGYAGTVSYGADPVQGERAALWKNGKFTAFGNLTGPGYRNWVTVAGVDGAGTVAGRSWKFPGGKDMPTVWSCR
ncbi:hypothetical protein CP973_18740 [Streptomyces albofaciens JCM 4342]|nr:hypothetical protein CP973_18740 [Streptomyces albofaciens JCM 4342]